MERDRSPCESYDSAGSESEWSEASGWFHHRRDSSPSPSPRPRRRHPKPKSRNRPPSREKTCWNLPLRILSWLKMKREYPEEEEIELMDPTHAKRSRGGEPHDSSWSPGCSTSSQWFGKSGGKPPDRSPPPPDHCNRRCGRAGGNKAVKLSRPPWYLQIFIILFGSICVIFYYLICLLKRAICFPAIEEPDCKKEYQEVRNISKQRLFSGGSRSRSASPSPRESPCPRQPSPRSASPGPRSASPGFFSWCGGSKPDRGGGGDRRGRSKSPKNSHTWCRSETQKKPPQPKKNLGGRGTCGGGGKGTANYVLPCYVRFWFLASAMTSAYDASFILLRPASLPGGKLHFFYKPYSRYIAVDRRYADLRDPLIYAIGLFGVAEVVLSILTLIVNSRNSHHAIPLAFTTAVLTSFNTLLYFYAFSHVGGGAHFRRGNRLWDEIFWVAIPHALSILIPGIILMDLWSRMGPRQAQPRSKR